MTTTITKCICDLCGKEGAKAYRVLAYRTFDASDGRSFYDPPYVEETSVDMCQECARRSTNIHSVGVMGREFRLEKSPCL